MRITVLVENATPSSRLAARHGLALWIEAAGRRVLFDVGPDGSALANAAALGIDVGTADAAVLSHGHADHGGGLGAYLAATHAASTPPLYVRPHAFVEHLSGTVAAHHDISLDAGLAASSRIVTTGARHRIAPRPDAVCDLVARLSGPRLKQPALYAGRRNRLPRSR